MLDQRIQRGQSIACMQCTLTLGQLVHFLVPFRVGQREQSHLVPLPRQHEADDGRLFDPIMKRSEEENLFTSGSILLKRRSDLRHFRQGFFQPMQVVVILAGAGFLPKGVIQFGGETEFTEEIAEGLVHSFSNR